MLRAVYTYNKAIKNHRPQFSSFQTHPGSKKKKKEKEIHFAQFKQIINHANFTILIITL